MTGFSLAILGLILVSAIADRKKTWAGLVKGMTMFVNIMPTILWVMVLMALVLYVIPPPLIREYLGDQSGVPGFLISGSIGSAALMPGFISYPLCSVLLKQGVSVAVVAVFITTLMMVGTVTLPLEARFFGWKASLLRNFMSLLGALVVAGLMGAAYAWL
ncbi:MAG: permease [bacterium]